jgi:hypothetical protein
VAEAIDRLQRAFLADDYDGLCAGMTREASRHAGQAAHGEVTTCGRDVRRLLALIRKGGGWRHAGAPRVVDVEADGSHATATVALDRHWQARIPLTRAGGRWQLSGFFGAPPRRAQQTVGSIAASRFPPAEGTEAEVVDAAGTPCPDLSTEQYPVISGGCRIDLSSRVGPLSVLTPFGYFKLDECSIDLRIRVDGSGRTWTEAFEVSGPPESVACGDVNACYEATGQLIPWRGRIHPADDDGFLHRVDMCLRTCVGNFIGELTFRFSRVDGGWRAEPVDGGGDTGFRFDGPFRVRGAFDVQPAEGG